MRQEVFTVTLFLWLGVQVPLGFLLAGIMRVGSTDLMGRAQLDQNQSRQWSFGANGPAGLPS